MSIRRTLQRRLWIKQFAQIFKAMVQLRFVKVEAAMEGKKMNNGGFPHQSAKYAPIQKLFLLPNHKNRTFDFAPPETGYECILHNHLFSTHLFFIRPKLMPLLPLAFLCLQSFASTVNYKYEWRRGFVCWLSTWRTSGLIPLLPRSQPARSKGWLYFLSRPLCCLQDILKGYQLIWLKRGRQIAFGCDSDPDLRMLFPCSNKHHQP